MKPPELNFRHYLEPKMRGFWMMTWHEDREISPGVPDLHYVPINQDYPSLEYRVGWLELKAIDKPLSKSTRISVEASQHQYIRRWDRYMPIHFLVRVVDRVYLIEGKYSKELSMATSDIDLMAISVDHFHQALIAEELPLLLRNITNISDI